MSLRPAYSESQLAQVRAERMAMLWARLEMAKQRRSVRGNQTRIRLRMEAVMSEDPARIDLVFRL